MIASEEWPSAEKMLTHEAAIIDLETLSRLKQNRETVEALLAEAKIPTCWLSREGQPLPESEATRVVVQKPLDPKLLADALVDLLGARVEARNEPHPIIELTEVVEDDNDSSAKDTD